MMKNAMMLPTAFNQKPLFKKADCKIRFLKKRFLQNPLSLVIRFSQSAFLNANPLFNVRDNGIPHLINEQNKPPLNRFQSRLAGWLVG
jgi:hypothetical protein